VPSAFERLTRRALLAAGTTVLAGLAGCPTGSTDSTPTDADESESPSGGSVGAPGSAPGEGGTASPEANVDADTATATAEPTGEEPATPELDLREANVTAVEFEGGDGSYGFDVTLYHDDDGEDGYANWWQVESLDGEQLGRRELLHAHSTAPFTRSETIDVPSGTTCVVVRGHDQTHEYGGRAAVVNLETGAVRVVDQGPDPLTFDASDCP
jgi:hypothetical protein